MPKPLRPLRFEGDLAYVPLSQGLEAVIDAADAHLVANRNWYAHRQGNHRIYALSKAQDGSKKIMVIMHRVIFGKTNKPVIDHIDGNGLNNRRSNLRAATYWQNVVNSRPSFKSKSGFKGVTKLASGAWRSQLIVAGKATHLGTFSTPEDAARAYDAAAIRIHGAFARLNFPEAA